MLVISEKRLKELIREQIEEFFNKVPKDESVLELKNPQTGADIIFPNYIKERFDTNQVTSLKDIL